MNDLSMLLSMLLPAFIIGFLGGAHCIGMCGGIIGALTLATKGDNYRRRSYLIALYNVGRIVSYVCIAVLFYLLIDTLEQYFSWKVMRLVAGVLIIVMGLYLADWWRGLVYLEKLGAYVWQFIQPMGRRLLPVKYPWQAFALGMVWGWLPCGLIYSALAYSATASSVGAAAATMLAFALGTLPAVLATGLLAERVTHVVKHRWSRTVMAVLMITFGTWVVYGELGGHHHHHNEGSHPKEQSDHHHHHHH